MWYSDIIYIIPHAQNRLSRGEKRTAEVLCLIEWNQERDGGTTFGESIDRDKLEITHILCN